MQYGVLPGGGSPKRPRKSPAKVFAGHLYNQVRRPSRFRGRLLFTIFTITGILCLIYGRKHAVDLSRTASSLKEYIPDSITDVLAQYADFEEQRWDDDVDPENVTHKIVKKPKFHLLIPAKTPTENLCKTLMSAAILNYPPPTLISYGNKGKDERPGADIVRNIFNFLHGKEAHENDLILVVEEDAWFQLPAEVTINRFFHGLEESNSKLVGKYGKVKDGKNTTIASARHQKYTMKVLFGAAKECSNAPSDPACYSIPESPLPKDIYGDETDRHPEGKYNRPRYMSSSMVMGHVADLRPIYKTAAETLEFDEIGKHGSQYVFSQILGLQEYARTLSLASATYGPSKWRSWLSTVLSRPQNSLVNAPNITLSADKHYEFGIGLDYSSSIFQVMNNSIEDVRFVRFNHPSVIASPSRISAKAFKNPIRIPSDLTLAPTPFNQNQVSSSNPDPPITELDNMHDDTALWTDIELSTNVIVPGSSVPASLNFHGSEYLLDGEMWEKMWFHPNARALMRQYIRSPDGPIAASAAAEGGGKWWDLRGGKGGVWTDRGEWLEWNEVCGAFDEKVFGDEKGEFMREKEEVGGQKAVYKFGQLVQGKLPKPKPDNLNAHKALLGDAIKTNEESKVVEGVAVEETKAVSQNSDLHEELVGGAAKAIEVGKAASGLQSEGPKLKQNNVDPRKGLSGEVITAGEGGMLEHATQSEELTLTEQNVAVDDSKSKQDNFKVVDGIPSEFGRPIDNEPPGPIIGAGENMPAGNGIQAGQGINFGQGVTGGSGMQGVQGPPMGVGGGMQVSGTMDLEAVKQVNANMFQNSKAGEQSSPLGDKTIASGMDRNPEEINSEDEKKAEEIIKATEEKQDDLKSDEKEGREQLHGHHVVDDVVEEKNS